MEAVTVQIAKLELKPGDILAVMYPKVLCHEQRNAIRATVEQMLPEGVKACVLDAGMTLAKIGCHEAADA